MGEVEKRLGELADEINAEHRAFVETLRATLEHGIRCGELLSAAKDQCPHGTWLEWLERNFNGSARTAQEYMRLYNHRAELRAKTRNSAHLSVSGALRELAAPVSNITVKERVILDRAREMHDAGYVFAGLGSVVDIAPVMERLERLPDESRRGFVAETAWAALSCWMREYGLARLPLEDGGAADLTPGELDGVVAAIHRTADELRWWVEQSEWIESQVRACDWPPGHGMPRAAFDEERKHLTLCDLYDDESEDGLRSPRGFVRDLYGAVV